MNSTHIVETEIKSRVSLSMFKLEVHLLCFLLAVPLMYSIIKRLPKFLGYMAYLGG